MFKPMHFILIPLILLLTACSTTPEPQAPSNVKTFEAEDRLALFALYAKSQGDANSTISLFNVLYEKSEKVEYRDEEVLTMIQSGQHNRALAAISIYKTRLEEGELDVTLERLKIKALVSKKSFEEAKVLCLILVEETKAAKEHEQLASLYMVEGRYDFALKHLQSAYIIDYNEKILDKLAIILYVNLNKKAEAISYLETHIRLHGCSHTICLRLASFYSEENNLEGMISVYLRLYDMESDPAYAQSIIKLYTYKKDTLALIGFLEKSSSDDALLLQMYINTKNYSKVVSLGDSLYKKEGSPYYLGQSAIFEYEGSENKSDKKMLDSVVSKLEEVVSQSDNAVYLNYYGYLLIDHDIDVKEGLIYIKEALKTEENSPYYLDSLAWGYYKQGKCSQALKLMKQVKEGLDKDDDEVSSHIKAINKCIKKGKR